MYQRTQQKSIKDFADLSAQADKIALGTPEAVPAGKICTTNIRKKLNIWNQVSSKVVYAKRCTPSP
ncbi:hypothetical protein GCM10020331_023880 [Ectobacillus funiculus]